MLHAAPRWVEVTPSQFPHEAAGLETVRNLLPNQPPFRAWSNFEFRDGQGTWSEVDLLVLGRSRLHLVELKYYSGVLRGDDHAWRRDGRQAEKSPLLLARRKAQRLSSRLRDELQAWARETGVAVPEPGAVIPYVQESVFLHHPDLRCELPDASRKDLFGLDSSTATSRLPGISRRLLEPEGERPLHRQADGVLHHLLARLGVRHRREREVGTWVIDGEPLDDGHGWQEWPARHRVVSTERARIRIHTTPAGAPAAERDRVRRLAEHEYRVLSGLQHDGLLRPRDLVDTEMGVGLVYPIAEPLQRLDLWLADQPDGIGVGPALTLVRQVAEAVHHAHRHRIVHRGLSPAAIWVRELEPDELRAVVGDWQSAGLIAMPTTSAAGGDAGSASGVTRLFVGADAAPSVADAFRAPEGVWLRDADRVRLDVFALGALTYYLLARRLPAVSLPTLRERLTREDGLDLAVDLPQVPPAWRDLVLCATRPRVSDRLPSVARFLQALDAAERALHDDRESADLDPLDATPGAMLAGRFRLERRLGSGSTAVGLLVTDLATPDAAAAAKRVLKVALNDAAAQRLMGEAHTLAAIAHPRVVKLLEPPLEVGGRRALLLESAGEQTLAEALRRRHRLSLDLLERWGAELLEALVALDRAGVDHRDLKPANLGVREDSRDSSKHLVLFDFSLSRAGASAVTAGTPPYLDPFLGGPGRARFDSAAERYAAAVVLFEMACGATPVYGDGLSDPATLPDEAAVAPGMFDAAVGEGLAEFFRMALARDAKQRHDTAADMHASWQAVFAALGRTVPDDADDRAARASASTPLAESGLSARALSAVEPLGVVTVGDLIAVDPVQLNRLSGVSDATRREVKQRAAAWRDRLGARAAEPQPPPTGDGRGAPTDVLTAAQRLVAGAGGGAPARTRAARLVLGLEPGVEAFATPAELGRGLQTSLRRAGELLAELQRRWSADAACTLVLTEFAALAGDALLAAEGVATVRELAEAVQASGSAVAVAAQGHVHPGAGVGGAVDQLRVTAGLCWVALDRAERPEKPGSPGPTVTRRRRGSRIEVLATDPGLLDIAEAAADVADRLVAGAGRGEVIGRDRAVEALRQAVPGLAREGGALSDHRLLRLATALAGSALLSGQAELYPRTLDPVAAARLALTGLGAAQPVTAAEIRDRFRNRFPALPPLPERPRLDDLLAGAGLGLIYDSKVQAYRAATVVGGTTGLPQRPPTTLAGAGGLQVSSGHVPQRLAESIRSRSFLALGVDGSRMDPMVLALRASYGARVVDVTDVLVEAMRREAAAAGVPWDAVRSADAAQRGTRDAEGLAVLVGKALPSVDAAIEAAGSALPRGSAAVALTNVAPLARYGHLGTLARWADLATARPQAVWVLVPQLPGSSGALIDGRALPLAAPGQYLRADEIVRSGAAVTVAGRGELPATRARSGTGSTGG